MPPSSPPPASAKPKGGNILTRKIGPFSGWVWLVMVGGSVAMFFLMRRSGGGTYEPETVSGNGGAPPTGAGAGAPSENAAPGMQLDPEVLRQLEHLGTISDEVSNLSRAFGTATGAWEGTAAEWSAAAGEITSLRQQFEDAAYMQSIDTGLGLGGTGASSPTVAATLGAPGKRPAQKNALLWNGHVYGRGTGSEFVAQQLKPKGVNPQSWAKKHPAAATYLGIPKSSPAKKKAGHAKPAPKAAPKRNAPVKAAPRVQAKVQPKAKAKAKQPKKVKR
jgi:hypothetical protein